MQGSLITKNIVSHSDLWISRLHTMLNIPGKSEREHQEPKGALEEYFRPLLPLPMGAIEK